MKDGYVEPVVFSVTNTYGCQPDDEDDVYEISAFIELCERKAFTDYDGHGHPVKDKKSNPGIWIKPSKLNLIPRDATHIVWFNR